MCFDKTLKGGNDTLRDIGGCFALCCLVFFFVMLLEILLLSVCWLVVRVLLLLV